MRVSPALLVRVRDWWETWGKSACVIYGTMLVACTVAACAQRKPAPVRMTPPPRPYGAHAPAPAEDFRQRSIELEVGMTKGQVAAILGVPSRSEVRTFGAGIGEPWNGLVWYYPRLQVCFSQGTSEWTLNSWQTH